MKFLGYTLHTLTLAAILAAIWTPYWWQFALTALVLFLAGAIMLGSEGLRHHGEPQGSPQSDREGLDAHREGRGDSERSAGHTGPTTVVNDSGKPEPIRHDRPTYGKPRNEGDR